MVVRTKEPDAPEVLAGLDDMATILQVTQDPDLPPVIGDTLHAPAPPYVLNQLKRLKSRIGDCAWIMTSMNVLTTVKQ